MNLVGTRPLRFGPELGVARHDSSFLFFFVRLTSDADGRVSGSVEYDVFGKVVTETGVFASGNSVGSDGMSSLVFGYAGKPYDPVTGLSDYGFRDYAPSLARFTTVDPIRDGSNWYAYCNSDPVNYVDAWGLCTSDVRTDTPPNMPDTDNLATTAGAVTIVHGDNEHYLLLQDKKQMEDIRDRFNAAVEKDENKYFQATVSSCDVYVTNLMDSSKVTPENWPNPYSTYVAPTSKKKGSTYKTELADKLSSSPYFGTNVMIMEGGEAHPDDPHMAYVLNDFMSGTLTVTHFISNKEGGKVITKTYNSQSEMENECFDYENFYYFGVDVVK